MKRILILSGGGFQGLGLLECAQAIPGVEPVIADLHADNVARYLCSRYEVVPPLTEAEAFETALERLVAKHCIEAVFPATARELPLLARMRDRLEAAGMLVAVSTPELVDTLLDKDSTARFLHRREVPTQLPVDPDGHDFGSPLFGKPRYGWGGTGTVVARDAADVRQHTQGSPSEISWFPFIAEFQEYSADFSVSRSGSVSMVHMRRRLRTSGGYAVVSESVHDEALQRTAVQAASAIAAAGGCGIFNVQLIQPGDSPAFVSDVNPRFGTSAVHWLAVGVNMVAEFLSGSRAQPRKVRPVRTVRYLRTITVPRLDRRPRGVVFDLDDTLVDHKAWMIKKMESAYAAIATQWVAEDLFLDRALQLIDEGERAHLIDRISGFFSWTDAQRWALIEAYRGAHVPRTPVYADVGHVLAALGAAGLKLALLTDNPVATQRSKIEAAPELAPVTTITFAREHGDEKPARSAFTAAAAGLGLDPAELCMVGDNYFRDALGAIRSGYGCAFLINRGGGFVQHHATLGTRLATPDCTDRIHAIENLTVLRECLLATC